MCLGHLVRLFATLWAIAHQAPLSMGILQARILEWAAVPSSRVNILYKDLLGGCLSHINSIIISVKKIGLIRTWTCCYKETNGRHSIYKDLAFIVLFLIFLEISLIFTFNWELKCRIKLNPIESSKIILKKFSIHPTPEGKSEIASLFL